MRVFYCFARPTHTYLDFDAGRDFEKEIVVKVNVPEVARAELMRPSWKREHVALGTNTDPYQWVEGRYRLMPGIWEAMRDSGTPSSVLTKSPLLLRDIELMKQIHEAAGFAANLSIPTLDEKAWRASEPHTPHPRKRIEAVAELNRAGIPTGVLIAPLMPGINDSPEQVEKILELCGEAGAMSIGGISLHLRGEVRGIFMDWLRSYRPDLVPRYEELYARGAYVGKAERERIAGLLRRGPGRRSGPGAARARGATPTRSRCPPAARRESRRRRSCSDRGGSTARLRGGVGEDGLAALCGHQLAELDAVGLGLVGDEDVDGVGVRVVELDLDGVGCLAAVRVGERHVRGDPGCADGALGRPLAQALVQRQRAPRRRPGCRRLRRPRRRR